LENALILLQPTIIIEYALTPKIEKSNKELNLINKNLPHQGIIHVQITIKIIINSAGLLKKINLWLFLIKNISLKSSLIPSATGCNSPNRLTLLGPKRI
jgi:hypothetical protein